MLETMKSSPLFKEPDLFT